MPHKPIASVGFDTSNIFMQKWIKIYTQTRVYCSIFTKKIWRKYICPLNGEPLAIMHRVALSLVHGMNIFIIKIYLFLLKYTPKRSKIHI